MQTPQPTRTRESEIERYEAGEIERSPGNRLAAIGLSAPASRRGCGDSHHSSTATCGQPHIPERYLNSNKREIDGQKLDCLKMSSAARSRFKLDEWEDIRHSHHNRSALVATANQSEKRRMPSQSLVRLCA